LAVGAAELDLVCNSRKIKRVRLASNQVLDQWGKDAAEIKDDYRVRSDNGRLGALLELVTLQHEY